MSKLSTPSKQPRRGTKRAKVVAKDSNLVKERIAALVEAQRVRLAARSEGDYYSHTSEFYGASFENMYFACPADAEAYIEWAEEERGWTKDGTPVGRIHLIPRV